MRWLVGCVLAAVAVPCSAGQSHYECEVLTASKLTPEGALGPDWTTKPHIGVKFTVDRETGRVIGGPLDNARMKIELIDRGSEEMSFQVFARSIQRTHTTYLEIQEYLAVEQKPFLGTTTIWHPGIYSGTCK